MDLNIINFLEKNKNFPYYAAERRIDLFVSFFSEKILGDYYKSEIVFVAPEFPIKHDQNNQADNADMLCAIKSTNQPIYVELKTDGKSFRQSQLIKYENRANHWIDAINGFYSIISKSSSDYRVKYFHLMQALVFNKLAVYSNDQTKNIKHVKKLINSKSRSDKKERSRLIINLSKDLNACWKGKAEVLYIGPDSVFGNFEQSNLNNNVRILKFSDIQLSSSEDHIFYN